MADSLLGQAAHLVDDVIVAVSTPQGRGAIGVVRLSGELAGLERIVHQLTRRTPSESQDRRLTLVTVHDVANRPLDRALLAWFRAPHSYTGEHVVELQMHGNPVLLRLALDACVAGGARLAGPGEFTRRALAHGKLSMLQAEGVDALIRAPSAAAARVAQRHLGGELGQRLHGWTGRLLGAAVALEALVDFPDEVEEDEVAHHLDGLADLSREMGALVDTARAGRRLLDGVRVAITGPVNAGKSTLLNALLGHDRAIVSPIAGTTRDVVSETVEWAGVAFRLEDTAGLRETSDPVEAIGIERSSRARSEADVVVLVQDGRRPADSLHQDAALSAPSTAPTVAVATHADLLTDAQRRALGEEWTLVDGPGGTGLEAVRDAIVTASEVSTGPAELVLHTARQEDAMVAAHGAVGEALGAGPEEPVLAAVALRRAGRALEELTGQWVDERVLDELFARFCIGK
ncbi:MAG: tRNA uridine-5-carboxymethylaminomethyl(34) synthesis GTPase MnmE [Deltaproteobacteria bacterium]|nr:tRNA uridine-5-carboxymethylaminomethyl(34) synthesis GTPase MnmE [Deltaproteobacteria bacterium]